MLENTLIGLVVKNASEMPDDVAMREKRFGVSFITTTGGRLRLEVQEQNVLLVAGRSSYNVATRRWKLNSHEHYYRPPILLGALVAVV